MTKSMYRAFLLLLCTLPMAARAQFLMDMIDTTKDAGKGMLGIYKKFDHLRFSGYIQPQFQIAESKGIKTFEGPDFGTNVNNRFTLRRSRVRIDYVHFGKETKPGVQIVFQFDVNERGFTIRDVWGRIFENKYQSFAFTTGMFARPFGYEVNLSSSDRETPERGRMSQTLMKSERDLGAMVTFEQRKKDAKLRYLKMDLGLFNGQGINATGEFDNSKDLIARLALKPYPLGKKMILSGGISLLHGGLLQNTKYKYNVVNTGGIEKMQVDSSLTNIGAVSPRRYYGADVQLKFKNRKGFTELRGEYIQGTQTGSANSSETPAALVTGTDGFHVRKFNGAYIYFLQHLFSDKHQLLLKYDWYDPNTDVKGKQIGAAGANLSAANIKYNTLGVGYANYITENVKLILYYAFVKNETTAINGYTGDLKDNVLTCRLQFRF
ncbi:phosphate-selective porin [Lacibacter cauensis]|uniref:Phosphate-selective porin n=1 Tax=Lacibacter cauensis TaxID=510947 RepID=A0A562SJA2_9BACT|nr:porin [Lacibacter cauensis]TWI81302.1 phosphate-selective porin [Lacibacter cauensis]